MGGDLILRIGKFPPRVRELAGSCRRNTGSRAFARDIGRIVGRRGAVTVPARDIGTRGRNGMARADADSSTPSKMLTVVLAVAVIAALRVGAEVIIPLALAVLFSFLLAPA